MGRDHRNLDAFKLADEMAIRVYSATRELPPSEAYGLRLQIRRAAVSVSTNIVEGCGRDSDREFVRFIEIAFGSCREVIYLVDLAGRLNMLNPKLSTDLSLFGGRVAAALAALRKSVAQRY